jgi:aerobic-type carbon monoxide dehydrogenase small subunit (CoxS/CutS family)
MLQIVVNGKTYDLDVDPNMPLLWAIRDVIGLTGTKYGCGIEACGACTVWIDGEPEKSCDKNVSEAVGRKITTIEGLSTGRNHPVQLAWLAEQVPQCGYCQSGMIMAVAGLLKDNKNPSDAQIDAAIGNICVCGTYPRVRAAIHRAAAGA